VSTNQNAFSESGNSPPEAKLCECGKCGLPAPIAKHTDARRGVVKGQPVRFILNHYRGGSGREPQPNPAHHLSDGTTVLSLSRRNGDKFDCLVDTADFALVSNTHWSVFKSKDKRVFYARSTEGVFMHRLILPDVPLIDHSDGNGLNNKRENLRSASNGENVCNQRKRRGTCSSRFKGVTWHRQAKKWRAFITANGQGVSLGVFDDEADAACAYDAAAIKLFGEFACLNFGEPEKV
jgi:hypothetical protein